jgi:hypothetical protein
MFIFENVQILKKTKNKIWTFFENIQKFQIWTYWKKIHKSIPEQKKSIQAANGNTRRCAIMGQAHVRPGVCGSYTRADQVGVKERLQLEADVSIDDPVRCRTPRPQLPPPWPAHRGPRGPVDIYGPVSRPPPKQACAEGSLIHSAKRRPSVTILDCQFTLFCRDVDINFHQKWVKLNEKLSYEKTFVSERWSRVY